MVFIAGIFFPSLATFYLDPTPDKNDSGIKVIFSFNVLTNKTVSLHWAACKGHTEVIKALLSAGADAKIVNKKGDLWRDIRVLA